MTTNNKRRATDFFNLDAGKKKPVSIELHGLIEERLLWI